MLTIGLVCLEREASSTSSLTLMYKYWEILLEHVIWDHISIGLLDYISTAIYPDKQLSKNTFYKCI